MKVEMEENKITAKTGIIKYLDHVLIACVCMVIVVKCGLPGVAAIVMMAISYLIWQSSMKDKKREDEINRYMMGRKK